MRSATHIRYEILRTFRNGKVLLLTLALPLVVFLAVTPSNRHNHPEGIPFALYFMTGMAAYGAMWAVVLSGAHIAIDRSTGWNRLLRITPLPTRTYFISKVITAYLVALPALGLLYLAGAALGVRLDATQWLEMTGLLLVGVAPFVVLGIILGHALPADALAPAAGGLVVLLALFGGVFGRLFTSGVMFTVVKLASLLLACPGRQDRVGNRQLAGGGLGRRGRVDRPSHPARSARVSARHHTGLNPFRGTCGDDVWPALSL